MATKRRRVAAYYWEGILPSVSATSVYSISIKPLRFGNSVYADEKHIVSKTHSTRSRVLSYFFRPTIFWRPEDTINSAIWSILLKYPPTYVISIGHKNPQSSIFCCYLRMPFDEESMYVVSPFLGRFIRSMMVRFTTTALLVDSENADEFYFLCIFAVIKSFYPFSEATHD